MKRKLAPETYTESKRVCTFRLNIPSDKTYTSEHVHNIVIEALSIIEAQLQLEIQQFLQHHYEKRRPPPEYIS